ncbi:MAG: hypothetical protein P0S93_05025 [Candidatus Neptunochlamydia sp.]|nr:hypothetical protein [Candidatus Neptunochlamydia sp.]
MKILSTALDRVVHFFYPAYCLHCNEKVEKAHHLLCSSCFEQLEWIDRSQRCPSCWGAKKCQHCSSLHPHCSLFEPCGPILELHREFLKTKRGKTLASLMVVALYKTSWAFPEVIVPLIDSPFPKQEPLYSLGKELAVLLSCSLSLPNSKLQDKKILLITDILWKTEEVMKEKQRLADFFPEKIFTFALIDLRF